MAIRKRENTTDSNWGSKNITSLKTSANGMSSSYTRPLSVALFNNVPRFIAENDVSILISGDTNDSQEYLIGAGILMAIISSIFLLWGILILIFKVLGFNKVGFLSGNVVNQKRRKRRRRPTKASTDYDIEDDSSNITSNSYCSCCWSYSDMNLRSIYYFSCFLLLSASILFFIYGTIPSNETTETFQTSSSEVLEVLEEFELITKELILAKNDTITRFKLIESGGYIESFCPGLSNNMILKDKLDIKVISEPSKLFDSTILEFNGIENLNYYAQQAHSHMETADEYIDLYVQYSYWCLPTLVGTLALSSIFLIVGAGMPRKTKNNCFFRCLVVRFILPLFIVATAASSVILIVVGYVAILDSDACSGGEEHSPHGTIQKFLEELDIDKKSIEYNYIMFVIQGCYPLDPFERLINIVQDIEIYEASLSTFLGLINGVGMAPFNRICGSNETDFVSNLELLKANLVAFVGAVQKFVPLIQCTPYYELYVNTIEDAACSDFVNEYGLMLLFLGVICFSALVILTFRAVLFLHQRRDNSYSNYHDDMSTHMQKSHYSGTRSVYRHNAGLRSDELSVPMNKSHYSGARSVHHDDTSSHTQRSSHSGARSVHYDDANSHAQKSFHSGARSVHYDDASSHAQRSSHSGARSVHYDDASSHAQRSSHSGARSVHYDDASSHVQRSSHSGARSVRYDDANSHAQRYSHSGARSVHYDDANSHAQRSSHSGARSGAQQRNSSTVRNQQVRTINNALKGDYTVRSDERLLQHHKPKRTASVVSYDEEYAFGCQKSKQSNHCYNEKQSPNMNEQEQQIQHKRDSHDVDDFDVVSYDENEWFHKNDEQIHPPFGEDHHDDNFSEEPGELPSVVNVENDGKLQRLSKIPKDKRCLQRGESMANSSITTYDTNRFTLGGGSTSASRTQQRSSFVSRVSAWTKSTITTGTGDFIYESHNVVDGVINEINDDDDKNSNDNFVHSNERKGSMNMEKNAVFFSANSFIRSVSKNLSGRWKSRNNFDNGNEVNTMENEVRNYNANQSQANEDTSKSFQVKVENKKKQDTAYSIVF